MQTLATFSRLSHGASFTRRLPAALHPKYSPSTPNAAQVMRWPIIDRAGNIALLLVKLYAFLASRSFAVLASLADSGVDLASQIVLFFCNRRARACRNALSRV